jgi:hypothetical protein
MPTAPQLYAFFDSVRHDAGIRPAHGQAEGIALP